MLGYSSRMDSFPFHDATFRNGIILAFLNHVVISMKVISDNSAPSPASNILFCPLYKYPLGQPFHHNGFFTGYLVQINNAIQSKKIRAGRQVDRQRSPSSWRQRIPGHRPCRRVPGVLRQRADSWSMQHWGRSGRVLPQPRSLAAGHGPPRHPSPRSAGHSMTPTQRRPRPAWGGHSFTPSSDSTSPISRKCGCHVSPSRLLFSPPVH